jgi:hypothetical protein
MVPGRGLKALAWAGGAALLAAAALQAAPALKNAVSPAIGNEAAPKVLPSVIEADPAPADKPAPALKVTPMAERVATVGLLNKRNGLWRDLQMKPGEARRIGDVVVRLKACETTAPWEPEKLTGAFVQVIVLGSDETWRKVFSGWLYKESPSLNVVEHPIYDVWAKACTMRFPDTGPETIVVREGKSSASGGRSNAKKSAPASAPSEPSAESADDSNDA